MISAYKRASMEPWAGGEAASETPATDFSVENSLPHLVTKGVSATRADKNCGDRMDSMVSPANLALFTISITVGVHVQNVCT